MMEDAQVREDHDIKHQTFVRICCAPTLSVEGMFIPLPVTHVDQLRVVIDLVSVLQLYHTYDREKVVNCFSCS